MGCEKPGKIKTLRLTQITLRDDLQMREEIDQETVDEYAEAILAGAESAVLPAADPPRAARRS